MRAVDFFCGCGGLSLGFENAGYKIVSAFDNWKPSVETYMSNFVHPIHQFDIKADFDKVLELVLVDKPEIIIGGPPCQDFSSSGSRDESKGRAELTYIFAMMVSKTKPKWFVMENVPRIVKSNALKMAKEVFRSGGYGMTEIILDASLFGVPQARKRFFLIGSLNETDGFMDGYIGHDASNKQMTMRDYFGENLGLQHYYRHPRSYARRGVFSINEPSATIRGVNRPIPNGYPGHSGDTSNDYSNIRPLTSSERSMIQTFPADFIYKGTKTDIEQMIGNAVPVKLAEYVAKCIVLFNNKKDAK